ncbi:amidase [Polychaeton citri CBS 116435]|uniref:Amidase n=1 Tax=Polychaeton citri CBS 116435 TaxID=1314669 RepID=A0A9P4Q887_9PEZI|nr:amidase [Polychaeton citri CBS 116435]
MAYPVVARAYLLQLLQDRKGFTHTTPANDLSIKRQPDQVRIDGKRVWRQLLEVAAIGGIEGTTGMNRLALSDSDQAVRDWFVDEARELGCRVMVDQLGNIFAVMPGQDNTLAPIGMGSHLDTQPNGGRFDGILGVLGALEVLRALKDSGIVTRRPLAAINWTNEEGARFGSGCTGSAVWAGWSSLEQAYAMETVPQKSTLYRELTHIGYKGEYPANHKSNPLSAHFELHIEQGRRLESGGHGIGVVTGIQGNCRLRVHVHGEQAHSGSTPMLGRSDALIASSKVVLHVQQTGLKRGGFATVGTIECCEGSINCIPGNTTFTVDLRHPHGRMLGLMEEDVRSKIKELECDNPKLRFEIEKIWESPATTFDEHAVDCVRKTAIKRFGQDQVMELQSFAGHDSAMTQLKVPTAMIFVPSKDGISHSPAEFTSELQCAHGVQTLADAILAFDRMTRMDLWQSTDDLLLCKEVLV